MSVEYVPEWMRDLEEEDITFIKKFVLASGSLKDMAAAYGVTYPTVRLRLDRLIQKIQVSEDKKEDSYVNLIKQLAINNQIDFATAKVLIKEYNRRVRENG